MLFVWSPYGLAEGFLSGSPVCDLPEDLAEVSQQNLHCWAGGTRAVLPASSARPFPVVS